jgi:hypothetical protein
MRGSECPAQTWILSRETPDMAKWLQKVLRRLYQVVYDAINHMDHDFKLLGTFMEKLCKVFGV